MLEVTAAGPEVAPSFGVDKQLRVVWRVSVGVLAVQLVGMLVFSTVQYQRFNLTTDFAGYSQAWAAVAHGHFDPYNSLFGLRFWRNDFELLIWPLAVFYWLNPHPVTLLWLQDIAVVGGELVVLAWIREAAAKTAKSGRDGATLLAIVAGLLALTPWSWFTIGFDFHLEPFGALFALLAAWDLWAGRTRRLLLWVPLTLASGGAGSFLIIAIGVAALTGRRGSRLRALLIATSGVLWLALASGVGAMRLGSIGLSAMYGYLASPPTGHHSLVAILQGLVFHPARAVTVLRAHAGYAYGYIASGGVLGLLSRWGLFPVVLVLAPTALNAYPFIRFFIAYQSWPAVLFLMAGSALALQWFAARGPDPKRVVTVLGGCTLALAAAVAALNVSQIPSYLERVSAPAAARLADVQNRMPDGAEIVASQGIIGRFGVGHEAFPYLAHGAPELYPISRPGEPVVFVLAPLQGTAEGSPVEALEAVRYVENHLHARRLEEGSGIWAFLWVPKSGLRSVSLP